MANIIRVLSKWPRDVVPAELEPLAQELREALAEATPDIEVHIGVHEEDEHRGSITLWETVEVVLETLGGVASYIAIKDKIVSVSGRWMKRRSAEKKDHRPRSIAIIYGPDNRIVSKVELDDGAKEARLVEFDDKKKN